MADGRVGFELPATISRPDFIRDGSDAAFRATIYTMVRALDGLVRCREIFARALDLTPNQFVVLMGTASRQGAAGVTIRDLAEHVHLASTHVTTEVGRLVRRKLLVKRPNAADGRSVLVSLSPAGEEAVRTVAPLVRRTNDVLFDGIAADDLDAIGRVTARLGANVERVFGEDFVGEGRTRSRRIA